MIMKSLEPNQGKLHEVFSNITERIPIIMVSLLEFRENADYGDALISCSGRKAYQTYSKKAL